MDRNIARKESEKQSVCRESMEGQRGRERERRKDKYGKRERRRDIIKIPMNFFGKDKGFLIK